MSLFHKHLKNIKQTNSSGQYIATCPNPNHQDNNPSFTFNDNKNVFQCFGCDWQGTEYELAVLMDLPNAKDYLRDKNGEYVKNNKPNSSYKKATIVKAKIDLDELSSKNKATLLNNMDK